jgi:hypothetical protein
MGYQPLRRSCVWMLLFGAKDHVLAQRVSQCIYASSRLSRLFIGVHAHATEVVAKPRFHERACPGIQRPARRTEHLVDDGWHTLAMFLPLLLGILSFSTSRRIEGRERNGVRGLR